ncbi:MAG: RDD family protein [Acidimicrobiia bacterium]|nr:RDD family protein [Acidimicrobiia bacterium]
MRQDVSGNYAGPVTRLLAHWVDIALAGFMFVAGLVAFDYVLRTIAGVETNVTEPSWVRGSAGALWFLLYWWVCIGVAGKTPGKALLGLRVLSKDGENLSGWRAGLRALSLPLSYLVFGIGFLGILAGRERRALHDVIAGSAVVYDWGPRTAELPTPISAFVARRSGADTAEQETQ